MSKFDALLQRFGCEEVEGQSQQERVSKALSNMKIAEVDGIASLVPRTSHLFISSIGAAYSRECLRTNKITKVLNLTDSVKCMFIDEVVVEEAEVGGGRGEGVAKTFTYKRVTLRDEDTPAAASAFAAAIDECVAFIDQPCPYGGGGTNNVLVHCYQGKSRAAAICSAYLLKRKLVASVDEALELVKQARPCIEPNRVFVKALRDMYKDEEADKGDSVVEGADALLEGTCHCGEAQWQLKGDPGSVTACNCTICRRYGALWAYGYVDENIRVVGPLTPYTRRGKVEGPVTCEFLFCPTCGCVLSWRGLKLDDQNRRRVAVNVRLAPPEAISHLLIDHFDGLDTFDDLPQDGRCVRDLWF